jgi:hypothetical protein
MTAAVAAVAAAAAWQRDSEAAACPLCWRLFSLFFRRHHCRACLRVVCGDCSEQRLSVAAEAHELVRVCDACALELSTAAPHRHPLSVSTRAANVERQWMSAAVRRALAQPSDVCEPDEELARLALTHGGVAMDARARVWPVLSGSVELAAANGAVYRLFVEQCDAAVTRFIEIDAARALPDDPRFAGAAGHAQLVRLLSAHVFRTGKRDARASAADSSEESHRRGSYRQEMVYIACVLLRVFADDDESAFWCFTQLLYQFDLARYFLDSAPLLAAHLALFERLVAQHEPALARHFATCLIPIELFAKRWFTTLFALELPTSAVLRLWDLLLVHGPRWALPRMGVAMLRLARAPLLACTGSSDLLTTLQAVPSSVAARCGELFAIMHALPA